MRSSSKEVSKWFSMACFPRPVTRIICSIPDSFALERILEKKGEEKLLQEVQKVSNLVSFCYVRQKEALGLGHAVLCARETVGNEPFAVLLGDMIIDSKTPALRQLLEVYKHY